MVEREEIERSGISSDHERISFLVIYISEHQRDFYVCAYPVNSTYPSPCTACPALCPEMLTAPSQYLLPVVWYATSSWSFNSGVSESSAWSRWLLTSRRQPDG